MATPTDPAWRLAWQQHDVITRAQLLGLGFTPARIRHCVATGRLYPVFRGVYAVGRPRLTNKGLWMAAVLACGDPAALSHESAGALWGIRPVRGRPPEVTVPHDARHRRRGIVAHRSRTLEPSDVTLRERIRVTTVVRTLIDISRSKQIERAVNEADRLGLIDPEHLRRAIATRGQEAAVLRRLLDRRTFTLTDSELERLFIPIALRAGLPMPQTGYVLNGFRVDFFWPELGLVVETDGLTCLRFTHGQIAFEPAHVERTLAAVARRCRR
jgi:predicted transcriptional regulator of viral defense system